MAKTAVGLFENSGSADGVVRDLTSKGFLQNDIRVLGEPVEMPGSGLMSTPHSDFEVDLIRDLTAFGVVEGDAEAYVQGVRRGGVMVFATGTNVAGLRTWNSLGRFVRRGEKGIFILAPMVGRRSTKDVATDERSEDATTEGQRTLYGFRAVYVFDRLSRDLRPSLCAPDGCRQCHPRKSPRWQ